MNLLSSSYGTSSTRLMIVLAGGICLLFAGCQEDKQTPFLSDSVFSHPTEDIQKLSSTDSIFFDSLSKVAANHFMAQQYDSASLCFKKIIRLGVPKQAWPFVIQAMTIQGNILQEQGQYERAIYEYFEPGLELIETRTPDDYWIKMSLFWGISSCLSETHRTKKAKEYMLKQQEALDIFRDSVRLLLLTNDLDSSNRSKLLYKQIVSEYQSNISNGLVHLLNRDIEEAKEFFDEAKDIMLRNKNSNHFLPEVEAFFWSSIYSAYGNYYTAKKRLDSAQMMHSMALEYGELSGNPLAIATGFYNLGDVTLRMKNYSVAIPYLLQSEEVYSMLGMYEEKDPVLNKQLPDLVRTYLLLARAYYGLEDKKSSITYLQQALELQSRFFKSDSLIQTNPTVDQFSYDLRSLQILQLKSGILADSCLKSLEAGICHSAQKSQTNATECLLSLRRAYHTNELALRLIDSIRVSGIFRGENSEYDLADSASSLLNGAIQIALVLAELQPENQAQYLESALQYSEVNKYNLLYYAVKTGAVEQFRDIPEDSLIKERILREELAYWNNLVFSQERLGAALPPTHPYKVGLDHSKEAHNRLLRFFERQHPEYYSLQIHRPRIGLQEIQKDYLQDQEAIIEFFQGKEAITIFLITQDTFVVRRICEAEGVEKLLQKYQKGISTETDSYEWMHQNYVVPAFELYERLMKPGLSLLRELSSDPWRVQIIGDRQINQIPIEALLEELPDKNSYDDPANWAYLIQNDQFTFHYQYSMAIAMQERQVSGKKDFAYEYGGFAPYQDAGMPALPISEEVVGIVGRGFKKKGMSYTPTEYGTYSKDLVKKVGPNHRILHISTHGKENKQRPMESGLYFSDDEKLTAEEIYDLSLAVELVILDACETGIGSEYRGEGMMSLDRAFAYAGASTIIRSQWTVYEKVSGELMKHFFQHLRQGETKDRALQLAKQEIITDGEFPYPYHWASMVMIGDPDSIYPNPTYVWYWGVLVLFILLFAGTFAFRQHKNKNL